MGTRVRHPRLRGLSLPCRVCDRSRSYRCDKFQPRMILQSRLQVLLQSAKDYRYVTLLSEEEGWGGEKCYQALSFVGSVIGAPSSSSHSVTSPPSDGPHDTAKKSGFTLSHRGAARVTYAGDRISTHIPSATVREALSAQRTRRSAGNPAVIFSTNSRGSRFPV